MSNHEEEAIGWEAIDQALESLYPKQEPLHYAPMISYILGGPDPLDGISVYERQDPVPHWHYVTYGFSELYEKESSVAEISGYGFELTFRLQKERGETEPPSWANHFLNNLARYVYSSGNGFEAGHYMNLNGPIVLEGETEIKAIAFVEDPELGMMETPNGQVRFLQIVGITLEEEDAVKAWNCLKVMELFSPRLPLYVTDLARSSFLLQDDINQQVQEGIEKDGSSTGILFVEGLEWQGQEETFEVVIGARQVQSIAQILQGRLPKGRSLLLYNERGQLELIPASADGVKVREGLLMVELTAASYEALVEHLKPLEKDFAIPGFDPIRFKIAKSYIKDQQGEVVEVIG